MATRQQSLTPLIDIQSAASAEQYERGVSWSMYGDEQGKGPVPASYLVTILQQYAERDLTRGVEFAGKKESLPHGKHDASAYFCYCTM